MHTWSIQEAESHFQELMNACVQEGAQLITQKDQDTAVLVPVSEWKRLSRLLPHEDQFDLELPDRKSIRYRHRPPPVF